jgi:hypothetical protein
MTFLRPKMTMKRSETLVRVMVRFKIERSTEFKALKYQTYF